MDLTRRMYSRELKIAAMREIDGGRSISEVARRRELRPKLLERWRTAWRSRGEQAFPGRGRPAIYRALSEQRRIAELERKIGRLTMENDLLQKAWEHCRDQHSPTLVRGAAACSRKSGRPPSKAQAQP